MVYLIGLIGFIGGFALGQFILSHLLRDYSREEIFELMKDRRQRIKYGLLNWLVAAVGAVSFVLAYNRYYLN